MNMAYRTLESVLHPDSHLALPSEELPLRPVRVMVTILEDDETADHADDLDIDPEHKKWMMEQVREALNDDPADAIEVTPEYWEAKRQKLEAMIADRAKP